MTDIRLFTDEDVFGSIAPKLRERGLDAISTPEAGRLGASDVSQLHWASDENRTLLTFNVADFARIHAEWMTRGRHHAGIVVSTKRGRGDLLRRVVALWGSLTREDMRDRFEYLSSW